MRPRRQLGGRAIGLGADVTDTGAMQDAVAETIERFGRLEIVVANAGIAPRREPGAADWAIDGYRLRGDTAQPVLAP